MFVDFVHSMLQMDPSKRPSASALLKVKKQQKTLLNRGIHQLFTFCAHKSIGNYLIELS